MTSTLARLKILGEAEAQSFIEDGWVVVKEAFPRELAERIAPLFWRYLREKPDDPSTWTQEGVLIKTNIADEPAPQVVTQRYRDVVDDLCGGGRAWLDPRLGYAPIRFPGFSSPPWAATGWHVDGNFFHHHVHSREQGLVGVDLFTEIDEGGGGTAVRVGSHRIVSRILAAHEPGGLSPAQLGQLANVETARCRVVEIRGGPGDAVLMHPHLVHGSSTNLSRRVRLAANRCVSLSEPMRLERDDGSAYSLVELAIRAALVE